MYDVILEALFAKNKVTRNTGDQNNTLYLTFDDGPDENSTPAILDVLKQHQVKATFFVVGEQAQKNPSLIQRMIQEQHTLGNHSLDHTYKLFFSHSVAAMKEWIAKGEHILVNLSGQPSVGFRPPNGIMTPTVIQAMEELQQPVILWSYRFFDTLKKWHISSAQRALSQLKSGDIILLHDKQSPRYKECFINTLHSFIVEAQKQGWNFEALPVRVKNNGETI